MSEIAADEVEVIEDVTEEFPAPSLGAALEALLIVAVEPLSTVDLAEATRHPVDAVATRLAELAQKLAGLSTGSDPALHEWQLAETRSLIGR